MKEIIPYQSTESALKELDNGGRFYNLFTKADDGKVTPAELAKAAGVFNDRQTMILYLEMAIHQLSKNEKPQVINSLSEDLKAAYEKYQPQILLPSVAKEQGKVSSTAIITGVPKHISSSTDFNGFIMVPIMTGNVTTMMMIPIFEKYEVYELRDEESSEEFIIAHTKGMLLPEKKIHCGGLLKELNNSKRKTTPPTKFLEMIYYSLP